MAVQTIETLKEKFKSGSFPTQQDYHDVFESFFSKNDSITTDEIKGVGDDSDKTLTQILATIPELPEGLDEFIAKVNSFLDDTDLADETINKWKEIESFLTGITDTETLTGLLASLKTEILAEFPIEKVSKLYFSNTQKIVLYNGTLYNLKECSTIAQGVYFNDHHKFEAGTKVLICDGIKWTYRERYNYPVLYYYPDNGYHSSHTYVPQDYLIGDWAYANGYGGNNIIANYVKNDKEFISTKSILNIELYENENGDIRWITEIRGEYYIIEVFRTANYSQTGPHANRFPFTVTQVSECIESTLEEGYESRVGFTKLKGWENYWDKLAMSEQDITTLIQNNIPEQKEYTAGDGIEISEEGVISAVKEVSNKKFCEIIDDLDASDAPAGTIAMYGGPTNDKYTHGFIYEKGEGGENVIVEANSPLLDVRGGINLSDGTVVPKGIYYTKKNGRTITKGGYVLNEAYSDTGFELFFCPTSWGGAAIGTPELDNVAEWSGSSALGIRTTAEAITDPESNSWTPLNVMNVIN